MCKSRLPTQVLLTNPVKYFQAFSCISGIFLGSIFHIHPSGAHCTRHCPCIFPKQKKYVKMPVCTIPAAAINIIISIISDIDFFLPNKPPHLGYEEIIVTWSHHLASANQSTLASAKLPQKPTV
jgi:hypothetical protein